LFSSSCWEDDLDLLTLLGTAIALGADAFAVAAVVSAALPVFTHRHSFRLIWHFGLFQSMMTSIGWFGGVAVSHYSYGWNTWIAASLLVVLGCNMARSSFHTEEQVEEIDPTRGISLVGLSVATSIDALAVGVSLSLMDMEITVPALIIGLTALLMTYAGTRVGLRIGTRLGAWAERIGGIVLILLGVRLLV
jgi:manganese efflux pump family protein